MVMSPLAFPSEPSGRASMASTRVAEEIMAAPTPWTARNSTSRSTVPASPQSSEVTAMMANPTP